MLLALVAMAFLALPAAPASAELIVELDGGGEGTVTSDPGGIECSNVGGSPAGPSCAASFGPTPVQLTATAGSGSFFSHWNGSDPFPSGFFEPSCKEGSATPCVTADPEGFGLPPGSDAKAVAVFDCSSFEAATGSSVGGSNFGLRTVQGTVDANGCGIDESYFEYGATAAYGSTTGPTDPSPAELSGGTGAELVSAETGPLEPNTTYHYRLVVSNLGGTAKGEDRTFTTGPAPVGSCPNEARRQEQGIAALLLPDCMALEMVSPPHKGGQPARFPNVNAGGSRVSFTSLAALGEEPTGAVEKAPSTYVATRGQSGWTTAPTIPNPDFDALWEPESQNRPSFTPGFSRWLGFGATGEQLHRGIASAYEAGLGGFFRPLSDPLVPLSLPESASQVVFQTNFQAASADHSHLYFQPGEGATYFGDDPTGGPSSDQNVYIAHTELGAEPTLELLQRDLDEKAWGGECNARLGGIGPLQPGGLPAPNGLRNQGAVSVDGKRTYLSARAAQPQEGDCDEESNKLRILERLETPSGPVIAPLFASECSRPATESCSGIDGDDLYQGASLDQTKIYFTTSRQLADSDLDGTSAECDNEIAVAGCDLYLYDRSRPAGERLVQVSAGEKILGEHEVGVDAKVYNGTTAIPADGSRAYFVAEGVLTADANPEGEVAQNGEPNLYMWSAESEDTSFLGTLDPEDAEGLWGGHGTWRNDAYTVPALSAVEQAGQRGTEGGDGHILVFESKAELTPSDGDVSHRDVYRYDADAGTLECLSCAPGSSASTPDDAPFDVDPRKAEVSNAAPGTDFAESRRWASEDGEVVGFVTQQALLPGDVDADKDGYLWRGGELTRLPGVPIGRAELSANFTGPYLSHDGSTVAFATTTRLLPSDGDSTGDIYVAKVNGGYPFPEPANLCDPGVSCREAQTPPPAPRPASESVRAGNLEPSTGKPNRCARSAKRALGLSKRAKHGRRNARRLARNGRRGRAKALHRRAGRLARAARKTSKRAKRCRARQRRRANTNRRTGK